MISIIMPAYNAAHTIENSIKSVLAQTYADFELIVVNDGSTDNTAEKALSSGDSRVRVLTAENGGPARGRNIGIKAVDDNSDYIMFIDADDQLLPDALERAVADMESGADIVFMGFTIVNPDGTTNDYHEPSATIKSEELGEFLPSLYKANLLNQVWAKLYRRDVVDGVQFRDFRWGEDRLFIFDCLSKVNIIYIDDYCAYLYFMQNGASLISGFYDRKAEACKEADIRALSLCEQYNVKDDSAFRYMFVKSIFSCFVNMFSPSCGLSRSEKLEYVSSVINDPYTSERFSGSLEGTAANIICSAMKSGNARRVVFLARLAAFASRTFPKAFQKIKHRK